VLPMDASILEAQVAYYRARAREYDQWFLREGRYDRGPEHRAEWLGEVAVVRRALSSGVMDSDVLELACGTGLWTEQLARQNRHVWAVDASPETIAINRNRVHADNVGYEVADIFAWSPVREFEAVFFAFWLSHVPPTRFEHFWDTVGRAVKANGPVFFVDSLLEQSSTAKDHPAVDSSGVVRRRLNDGREFDIVKVFYEPAQLERRLAALGWRGTVQSTAKFFLFGSVSR
jgi:demethylmenaquinone methyltransferase/2-methoxy-6-polyprenyl-1,4-benzoquinol methylase